MTSTHKRNRVCRLRALTRAGARQQSGRRAGGACSTGLQPRILQLNTEGLTTSKIISCLAVSQTPGQVISIVTALRPHCRPSVSSSGPSSGLSSHSPSVPRPCSTPGERALVGRRSTLAHPLLQKGQLCVSPQCTLSQLAPHQRSPVQKRG
ncbi:hypothetical protein AAFF_G00038290 [Aldrovandia affinis]|uniref:Uncharacterized protein n=1 Tax=Aldrovandia affinis TaxID=143900 RepID=A0AAD7WZ69_9TELE|nr:hypothetical protein AAFF_G00038290 [Aldrovandia affinis]